MQQTTCAIPYEERNVYVKLRGLHAATAAPFVQWLLLLLCTVFLLKISECCVLLIRALS
jgi:hypothetical protein